MLIIAIIGTIIFIFIIALICGGLTWIHEKAWWIVYPLILIIIMWLWLSH